MKYYYSLFLLFELMKIGRVGKSGKYNHPKRRYKRYCENKIINAFNPNAILNILISREFIINFEGLKYESLKWLLSRRYSTIYKTKRRPFKMSAFLFYNKLLLEFKA